MLRPSLAILVIVSMLLSAGFLSAHAQMLPQLELSLVGSTGSYIAPAGQTTSLKIEILNEGPGDVYLVQGEAYLDPILNGNWQLIHSESTGNFHLNYLQSAIWTFDLAVPSVISAANTTNGVPQVSLLIKILYATHLGQNTASAEFALGVPGATVGQGNYLPWIIVIGTIVVLVAAAMAYRRIPRPHAKEL